MKTAVFIFCLFASAIASPKHKLNYFNNFKTSLVKRDTKQPTVIGGIVTKPHSFPYMALLEFFGDFGGWYCGGTVISQNYILTSANCASLNAKEVLVTLGAHNIYFKEDTQIIFYSNEIKLHDNYDGGLYYDIALIKLPETISFTNAIQPVTLPKKADVDNTYEGNLGQIAGWGSDSGYDQNLFLELRYTDVQVVNKEEGCGSMLAKLPETTNLLCTSGNFGEMTVGPCNGDAGGPLVADGSQIGIISFGMMYCLPGTSAVHTKLAAYLDWIETNSDVVIN